MPTCTERRRLRADPGPSTALGEACQVAKILCEKIWPLSSSEDRLKLGGNSAAITRQRCTNTWPANGREERRVVLNHCFTGDVKKNQGSDRTVCAL